MQQQHQTTPKPVLPLTTSTLSNSPLDLLLQRFSINDPTLPAQLQSQLVNIKRSVDQSFALFSHQLTTLLGNYNLVKFAAKTGEDVSSIISGKCEDDTLIDRMKEYPVDGREFEEALENCRIELEDGAAAIDWGRVCPTGNTLIKRYNEQLEKYFPFKKPQVKPQAVFKQIASSNFAEQEYRGIESLLASTGHKLKHVSLIFRASEHAFRSKAFKQICSKMQKTMVVVKSTMKKIFGGYTPCKWLDTKQKEYIADSKGQSFLFSLDEKLVFPIRAHQIDYAISSYGSWGPIFGSPYGPDLSLSDQCHLNEHSCSSLGSHYEIPITVKQFSNQAFCLLAGTKKFKVLEYEVFEVRFE